MVISNIFLDLIACDVHLLPNHLQDLQIGDTVAAACQQTRDWKSELVQQSG
jgi:hypothetical protein